MNIHCAHILVSPVCQKAAEQPLNVVLVCFSLLKQYEEARARGDVRFSHKAMQAALLITLYQDEPVLNQASRLLRAIVDIDELMTVLVGVWCVRMRTVL